MRFFKNALVIAVLSACTVNAGDPASLTIEGIFNRPLYAQPVATLLGTGTNTGWYQSAAVGKEYGWGIALPVSLVFINNNDRQYEGTINDPVCVDCNERAAVTPTVDCKECVECIDFVAPTLFGTIQTPGYKISRLGLDGSVSGTKNIEPVFTNGVKEIAEFSLVPFATLQAMFSWNYTALTLRYIGIPSIAGFSFQFPGVGIQHDLSRFLPPFPVSLSVAGNITFLNFAWEIKDVKDAEGTLRLNGLSSFAGILAGSPLGFIEMFLEMGWEHSYLKPGGDTKVNGELLTTNQVIPGRNGFRAALNIALPIKYNPVVGGIAGAQFGTQVTLLSYKSKKK